MLSQNSSPRSELKTLSQTEPSSRISWPRTRRTSTTRSFARRETTSRTSWKLSTKPSWLRVGFSTVRPESSNRNTHGKVSCRNISGKPWRLSRRTVFATSTSTLESLARRTWRHRETCVTYSCKRYLLRRESWTRRTQSSSTKFRVVESLRLTQRQRCSKLNARWRRNSNTPFKSCRKTLRSCTNNSRRKRRSARTCST